MHYEERNIDLFKMPDSYTLAHCISADFKLGAGIAKEFAARDVKAYLIKTYPVKWSGNGYALTAPIHGFNRVFNLITKEYYYRKPTYDTLKEALLSMKSQINDNEKIAMPCIGCGLDRLEWDRVKQIIINTFSDTNATIVVCHK